LIARWIALAALAALAGCAGAGFNGSEFQREVAGGQVDAALKRLDKLPDEDVSALLDRGLLLQSAERYTESNAAFARAEQLMEDLYTRSLSKEGLALLTSDWTLDYRASSFEFAYIAYYRAWNYLQMGRAEDVLVEARRINERLNFRTENCGEDGAPCGHDAFLRYFSGLLFEWAGRTNDAYISYKLADRARNAAREMYGTEPPPDLGFRLFRLARELGFRDEAESHAAAYGIDVDAAVRAPAASIVVIWENGLVGRRESVSAVIPILKGESEKIAGDSDAWSHTLAKRHRSHYEKEKLDYLLRISLPEYVAAPPAAGRAEVAFTSMRCETYPVAGLSAMAAQALDSAMGGILVRAVSRGLVKYLATKKASEAGEGAGLLVNLVGMFLENADTRAWRSLPFEIQVASVKVPPGGYDGRLTVYGRNGEILQERDITGVQVPAAGIAFIRHRSTP
jgi:hypothetical protein